MERVERPNSKSNRQNLVSCIVLCVSCIVVASRGVKMVIRRTIYGYVGMVRLGRKSLIATGKTFESVTEELFKALEEVSK